MSRLVVFVETSQTLPAILFFTAVAYKQNRIVAVNEPQTRILCLQVERVRSKMLCAVDYIFNLLCAFNCLQPMRKFVFSVASRATGRLHIKPSGSGDENGRNFVYNGQHFGDFFKCIFTILSQIKNEKHFLPVSTDKPKVVAFLVFVCTTASFIAQTLSFENVSERDAILAPVAKQ